jgi:hypothetical protein
VATPNDFGGFPYCIRVNVRTVGCLKLGHDRILPQRQKERKKEKKKQRNKPKTYQLGAVES